MELMHLCCQLQVKQDYAELTTAAGVKEAQHSCINDSQSPCTIVRILASPQGAAKKIQPYNLLGKKVTRLHACVMKDKDELLYDSNDLIRNHIL